MFFEACMNGDFGVIKSIINSSYNFDVNGRHPLGWTGLHSAASNGHAKIVKYLIEMGADVNAEDYFTLKSMEDINKIVRRKSEFNNWLRPNKNYEGCTALHYAVLADDLETVIVLTKSGADPNIVNKLGHKPISYVNQENTNLVKHLQSYMDRFAELERQKQLEERRKFPLEKRLKQFIVGK